MNAKLLLVFIFLIFSVQLCFGQEQFDDIIEEIIPKTNLTNEQLRHLREELKVQKFFIEGVKQIELSGGKFTNIEKSTNTIHDLLVSSIGAKSTSVTKEIKNEMTDVIKGGINKQNIRATLEKARDFAYGFGNNKKVFMTSVARRFGFDVGLVYMASLQVDLTFPLVMIASGQPQYAVLLATPVSSIATGTYAAVKSAVKFRHLVRALGGVKNTINHFKIFRKVKSFFHEHIILKHDLIDFGFASKNFVMTVERQNLYSKMLNRLGFNKNLNYANLTKLLEENNFMPKALEQLRRSNRPDQVKFLRLLNKVQLAGDQHIFNSMQDRFGKFINELDNIPDFGRQRKWVLNLAHSQDFDQFITRLAHMPDDIPPKIMDRVWKNYILQKSSTTIGPYMDKETYKAFRKLYESYDKGIRVDFITNVDSKMGSKLRGKFVDYIYNSLSNVGICGHLFKKRGDFRPLL